MLRDLGNTVIVVEHDEETMRAADHVIDLGPGAGKHGGLVIAEGTVDDIIKNSNSLTGLYLKGELEVAVPETRRPVDPRLVIRVEGAKEHNLQNLTVEIPLGLFVAVTGVSGSGKSTLIEDILHRALARHFYRARVLPGAHKRIAGLQHIDKVIDIDQSPIGRTPRSNPATYTGLFTPIRELFAELPEAKIRGYGPGRFSFNVKGGRCEACQGDGLVKIEMHFLPDVYVPCEVCKGKRYNRETLEVHFRGKSIADVLDLTVADALEFFENQPRIRQKLQTLDDVGLGYVHLGQSATTLSGGEAQRVKLATELSKRDTGPHALHPRRADDRPAFRGRPAAARRAPPARRARQHRARDRAQPRRHQDRRLDHRSRPRRRDPRRDDRRRRNSGRCRRGSSELHRPIPQNAARQPTQDCLTASEALAGPYPSVWSTHRAFQQGPPHPPLTESYMKRASILGIVTLACAVAVPLAAQQPAASPPLTQKLGVGPEFVVGTLPNGLRYYIRKNAEPAKRAELRLAVNAGSILEDPDQLGYAHFIEHTAFNGTTHFKKNDLIKSLESMGVRFGADLNAYTSFDETVYQLSVPTDTTRLLETAFLILEDWAHGQVFDSTEVVNERGVVLEEWRSRLGANDRMLRRSSRSFSRIPSTRRASRSAPTRASSRRSRRSFAASIRIGIAPISWRSSPSATSTSRKSRR